MHPWGSCSDSTSHDATSKSNERITQMRFQEESITARIGDRIQCAQAHVVDTQALGRASRMHMKVFLGRCRD